MTDFGFSKTNSLKNSTDDRTNGQDAPNSSSVGTKGNVAYKAPEQFCDPKNNMYQQVFRSGNYGRHQLDIYAYGGILYTLSRG